MKIKWMREATEDLLRVCLFRAKLSDPSAKILGKRLKDAPKVLLDNPRICERLPEFNPRDVRRMIATGYEIRYEIAEEMIYILQVWHTREDR